MGSPDASASAAGGSPTDGDAGVFRLGAVTTAQVGERQLGKTAEGLCSFAQASVRPGGSAAVGLRPTRYARSRFPSAASGRHAADLRKRHAGSNRQDEGQMNFDF